MNRPHCEDFVLIPTRWRPYFTLAVGTVGLLLAGYSRSMVSAPNGTSLDIQGCSFEAATIYQYDVSLKFALTLSLVAEFEIFTP